MSWRNTTLVAFDTETTGTDPETARLVTAAVVTVDPNSSRYDTRVWLADPGIDIPAEATAVHGITTEQARTQGRPVADVAAEIAAMLAEAWMDMLPVIVYNAAFDLTLLDRELRRHRGETLWTGRVIDPLVIDKHYDRYRKGSRRLVDVARHYNVILNADDAHRAEADALAAARVAWQQGRRYPELAAMPLSELHAAQIEWRAQQCASLQDYLRRKGSTETVNPEWPLHTPATTPTR